ncbi:iron ABC transporter substrate-binding protein [Acetohalobium arabaticum]|uniref:Periplasmic binding protein n=1 Tax=Acetohalobium arabaticum (strain ATCC 49924 / DSM 5501 / Z-7288) TaxID=574087 RepID=D9QVR7_ACEAZ|nr:iron ABC transporter substrate-binding protein [Acetohalobium arabaticum]ADL12326.1 periplasmic binding protein [Acetohalobium arabaticum DSM 5501]
MQKKKWFSLLVVTVVSMSVLIGGCADNQAQQTVEKTEITDLSDRKVEIPRQVDRIVALGSGALRQIVYLGAADKVVGVEEIEHRKDNYAPYNLAHQEFRDLPTVGPNHGGDAELIAAQAPDVIFFKGDPGEAKDLQQKTGIPVINLAVGDFPRRDEVLYQSWRLIGKILDREERVEELIQYMEDSIADLKERTVGISDQQKPEVYAGGITHRGGHGIAGAKEPFPPFQFVQAKNVAGELGHKEVTSVMVSREKILDWNPEIIFINSANEKLVKGDLQKHSEYKSLTAIEEDKVYGVLPYSYYHRNFGSILANSYYIGKILYPDRFSDIDPAAKADEIYKEFIGKAVYDQMEEKVGGFKRVKLD